MDVTKIHFGDCCFPQDVVSEGKPDKFSLFVFPECKMHYITTATYILCTGCVFVYRYLYVLHSCRVMYIHAYWEL